MEEIQVNRARRLRQPGRSDENKNPVSRKARRSCCPGEPGLKRRILRRRGEIRLHRQSSPRAMSNEYRVMRFIFSLFHRADYHAAHGSHINFHEEN